MNAIKFVLVCIALRLSLGLAAKFKFTNLKCIEFDRPFATFEKCYLKVVNRGVVSTNFHVKLYELAVTNVSLNAAPYNKLSGYRPVLYNLTVDFCLLMKYPNRFPVLKILHDILGQNSNINHTCPYNHDIIVQNLTLNENMFAMLPLPVEAYMLKMIVGAYNVWRANVEIYWSVM